MASFNIRIGIKLTKKRREEIWKEKQALKKTKAREMGPSHTRQSLDWIAAASRLSILETNIYSTPTLPGINLPKPIKVPDIFEMLVAEIQPKLIVAHGQTAAEYLEKPRPGCTVWSYPHLSRIWYEIAAKDVGKRISEFSF